MPTLAYSTSFHLNYENGTLKTDIKHTLLAGPDTLPIFELKRPLPHSIDVVSCSDLTILISVFEEGAELPACAVLESKLAQSLVCTLRLVSFPFVSHHIC